MRGPGARVALTEAQNRQSERAKMAVDGNFLERGHFLLILEISILQLPGWRIVAGDSVRNVDSGHEDGEGDHGNSGNKGGSGGVLV